ncbi:hypothetical protein FAZ95_38295 [Trinickia violacea]|uniref:Uncharacterized protein n=1 Tax=Trinickia violacea TaxID=2571746 RepID=A0A4P8J3A9_9BURK|nr:hypothetical protein [Trinickia violacea]QCP54713.1 hypothetical protein FAZ95_38295 [Trinickia violacea]
MTDPGIVPISGALSRPMERLFRAGGFALAFGFSGLFLIVFSGIAGTYEGSLRFPIFSVGCLLTFSCLAYFVFTGLKAKEVARSVKEDLPLLDALQHTAYQVAEVASVSQALAFRHLAKIQAAIEVITPLLEKWPPVRELAKKAGLTDSAKAASVIVAATEGTKETIQNLQEAIRLGDLKEVKKYGKQLDRLLADLKSVLKADGDE